VDGVDQLSIFPTVGSFGPGHPRFLQIEVGMDGRDGRDGRDSTSDEEYKQHTTTTKKPQPTSSIQQQPTSHNHEQQQRQQQHHNRLEFADDKFFVNTAIDPGQKCKVMIGRSFGF